MAHTMQPDGATDLIKPDHTTILLGFMVHSIGLNGQGKRWECDDYLVGVTTGDFWKIYVR